MANVSPELFRRRMAFRAMDSVKSQIKKFKALSINDNAGARDAAFNELAAELAALAGRPDLASHFERRRDELVAEAQTFPLRRRRRKPANTAAPPTTKKRKS